MKISNFLKIQIRDFFASWFKNHYYTLHRISFHILDISFLYENAKP